MLIREWWHCRVGNFVCWSRLGLSRNLCHQNPKFWNPTLRMYAILANKFIGGFQYGLSDLHEILYENAKISTRSGRDMGCYICRVNIFCRLSIMHESDRQTDRPWNGNIDANRLNRVQRCRLKSSSLYEFRQNFPACSSLQVVKYVHKVLKTGVTQGKTFDRKINLR